MLRKHSAVAGGNCSVVCSVNSHLAVLRSVKLLGQALAFQQGAHVLRETCV